MPRILAALLVAGFAWGVVAQEKSVRPDINKSFANPNPKEFLEKFEGESREVFAHRKEIVDAAGAKPGMAIADVGAGTGLFTRLFAREVGERGTVYAVDIAQPFLDHIAQTCRDEKLANVKTIRCSQTSTELPERSVDLVFVCDTYHHFEFPQKTLASIRKALRPNGRFVVIDFERIEGVTKEWTLKHVRAGKETFRKEIEESGFALVEENRKFLKENYCLVFRAKD